MKLFCLALFLSPVLAQEVQEQLTVTLREVKIHVVNRQGNPVTGLTREDFQVFEKGEQQSLDFFEEVQLGDGPHGQPHTVGNFLDSHGNHRRSIVMVFDSSNMNRKGFGQMLRAAHKFLDDTLRDGDLVKIVQIDEKMIHHTPFTTDQKRLKEGVNAVSYSGWVNLKLSQLTRDTLTNISDFENAKAYDLQILNLSGTDPRTRDFYEKLVNIRVTEKEKLKQDSYLTFYRNMLFLTQILKPVKGSKSIMLLTGGNFLEAGGDLGNTQSLGDRLARMMNANNITAYSLLTKPVQSETQKAVLAARNSVDIAATGFDGFSLNKASKFSDGRGEVGAWGNTVIENQDHLETGPFTAAHNTGGFFKTASTAKKNINALKDLYRASASYYRLAYSRSNPKSRHNLKVVLRKEAKKRGYKLVYGKHFESPKPYLQLTERQRVLEFEALLFYSQSYRNDLLCEWGFEVYPSANGFSVPVFTELPPMTFPKQGLEVGYALLNSASEVVDVVKSNVTENPEGAPLLLYDVLLTQETPHSVRFYVRNLDTGELSIQGLSTNPASPDPEATALGPVLVSAARASRMVPLNLYRADGRDNQRIKMDPLSLGDSRYKPNPPGPFSNPREIGFFFPFYHPRETAGAYDLQLNVTLGGKPVPMVGRLSQIFNPSPSVTHYCGSLDTGELHSGNYTLAVTMQHKATGAVTIRTKDFVIEKSASKL